MLHRWWWILYTTWPCSCWNEVSPQLLSVPHDTLWSHHNNSINVMKADTQSANVQHSYLNKVKNKSSWELLFLLFPQCVYVINVNSEVPYHPIGDELISVTTSVNILLSPQWTARPLLHVMARTEATHWLNNSLIKIHIVQCNSWNTLNRGHCIVIKMSARYVPMIWVHLRMELHMLLITEALLNISSHTNTGRPATNLSNFDRGSESLVWWDV